MTKTDKYIIELEKKLSSSNTKEVVKTINEIKSTGRPSAIPLLINLLHKHKDNEIGKEVLTLLGQLKDKDVVPYIIKEVKSKENSNFKAELIMTCWQSGLDYSVYIIDFAEEFIRGDYRVAIEAFSVIEEWIHNTPKQTILDCKQKLLDSIHLISEEKKSFYLELVKLVDGYL